MASSTANSGDYSTLNFYSVKKLGFSRSKVVGNNRGKFDSNRIDGK